MAVPVQLPLFDASQCPVRDQGWLANLLDDIWRTWFPDVARITPISIEYVRPWKRRLAVIYLTDGGHSSFIGVNCLLSDRRVPYEVCLITVAHELVHYCHGFGSHHPRRYAHPHRGGVVQRELKRRGLGRQLRIYTDWTNGAWFELYDDLARTVRGELPWQTRSQPQELAAARLE